MSINLNPKFISSETPHTQKKVWFVAGLVALIVVIGSVAEFSNWNQSGVPAVQQTVKKLSPLEALDAINPHPVPPPPSVLKSLTAINPHPTPPPSSVLKSLSAAPAAGK